MTITWRNVDAPNQSTANQMIASGSETMLNSFDKLTGIVKKKQDEQDALALGQLQAVTAGVGASDDIRAILGAGISSGMGGAQLSALASGTVAQGKNLFDQGLDADKLAAQQEQFNISQDSKNKQDAADNAIRQGQLANQVAGTQANIANNAAQMTFKEKEFKQRVGESNQDFALRLKQIDSTISNNNARYSLESSKAAIEAAKANGEIEKTSAYNSIVSSDEFKSASTEDKALMLAPFMDANDVIGSLNNTKRASKDGKGAATGVKDAKALIGAMGLNTKETINAHAILQNGIDAGFDPTALAAWIDKKENPSTLFEYGQRVAAGSPKFMASDFIEFSKEHGYVLPPHLADPETARKLKEAAGFK